MKDFSVGMVGLGAMGAAMARNFARAGLLRMVWSRTREKAENMAHETQAECAAAPAAIAARCNIVVISMSDDAALMEVAAALIPGLAPATVVIDTSTVARATVRTLAAQCHERGAHFLDAPVTGGVEGARAGTLAMMVGGDAEVFARVQPVLRAISARAELMGEVGSGQATKAVNQLMVAGINQAVSEALALAQALGLPLERVVDLLNEGAAANWQLRHRGAAMIRGEFAPGFRLALHHKDMNLCKALAAELNAQLPIAEMTLIHYKRLMAAGFGGEDISALLRQKQQLFTEGK